MIKIIHVRMLAVALMMLVSVFANANKKDSKADVQMIKPTTEFSAFWTNLREAFLLADPVGVAVLSRDGKFPLRDGSLDVKNKCEYKVAKAFMTHLHKTIANKPPYTWKQYLQDNPTMKLRTGSGMYMNSLGEHSAQLKVRFVNNGPNKYWRISEVLYKTDEVYRFSKLANGPTSCN